MVYDFFEAQRELRKRKPDLWPNPSRKLSPQEAARLAEEMRIRAERQAVEEERRIKAIKPEVDHVRRVGAYIAKTLHSRGVRPNFNVFTRRGDVGIKLLEKLSHVALFSGYVSRLEHTSCFNATGSGYIHRIEVSGVDADGRIARVSSNEGYGSKSDDITQTLKHFQVDSNRWYADYPWGRATRDRYYDGLTVFHIVDLTEAKDRAVATLAINQVADDLTLLATTRGVDLSRFK